jgi:tryptophanyl-tRNA synthetase
MKAKTDSGPTENDSAKPDYIENLFTLMSIVSDESVKDKFNSDFNSCVIRYGDMKKQLAEDMVNFIRPIREKAADIQHNKQLLDKIIKTGAEKARASASATLNEVRKAIRINY